MLLVKKQDILKLRMSMVSIKANSIFSIGRAGTEGRNNTIPTTTRIKNVET
jgi:hypothetical protein